MLRTRIAKVLGMLAVLVVSSAGVIAQKGQDCRTKEDVPLVTGHWKDDQTGKKESKQIS
jgi:hypothetical protein